MPLRFRFNVFAPGSKKLRPGDRVRISAAYPWATGATGTIRSPRKMSCCLDLCGFHREEKSPEGLLRLYWVRFDEAHLDDKGEGPYTEAEIDSRFLELQA